jgi:hypothetical protein
MKRIKSLGQAFSKACGRGQRPQTCKLEEFINRKISKNKIIQKSNFTS